MKLVAKPYLRQISLKHEKIREEVDDQSTYPFSIPCIRLLEKIDFHPDVTFLVGENGSGKSTLLEAIAIAVGFNPEGGTKNFNFSTRRSHSELCDYLRIVRSTSHPKDGFFLRAESFFNVATQIEKMDEEPALAPPVINSYGGVSLHEQSHGESFFTLMHKRFRGKGLYILDEPEAAVSPMRQMAMLQRIHELVEQQSQFIIATHSPILLAYPEAKILLLNQDGSTETGYQDTEHYKLTKRFLDDPQAAIRELFPARLF